MKRGDSVERIKETGTINTTTEVSNANNKLKNNKAVDQMTSKS